MELTLNLAWLVLTVFLVKLWLRPALPSSASTRSQMVALITVIVIMFPVISVTDDLQMAQNPTEADTYYLCTRRDQAALSPHSILPTAATLPPPAFTELTFGFLRFSAPGSHPAPLVEIPALASIQNRPPPVA
jgi:hypothetical protein